MLSRELIEDYNASRNCVDCSRLCHAPMTNLFFHQEGTALACCMNTSHVLGRYPEQTIHDMWFGNPANELRNAIVSNDLSLGCGICSKQLSDRNFPAHMGMFDRTVNLQAKGVGPSAPLPSVGKIPYPVSMEFALTNICNLECIMCSGDFSSLIRRNRENRPALRSPWDDAFVEQLKEFLPHLIIAKFYGGEPFMIKLYQDIWEQLVTLNPAAEVNITTNATTLYPRAKEILEGLRCHIIVSLDSLDKKTYESIRRNADFETVRSNLDWFIDYTNRSPADLGMSLAVCPMQQNWREIPDLVNFCSRNNMAIGFNTVYYPETCSLRTMSSQDLSGVAHYWEDAALDEPWNERTQTNAERFRAITNQVRQWQEQAFGREKAKADRTAAFLDPASKSLAGALACLGKLDRENPPEKEAMTAQVLQTAAGQLADMHRLLSPQAFQRTYLDALAAYKPDLDYQSNIENLRGVLDDHLGLSDITRDWAAKSPLDVMRWISETPFPAIREALEGKAAE